MKKLITALLLLTALVALTVTASAAEKYLTMPQTEYAQNEDILITASGEGKDWVGIYGRGETPGGPASIYWYYVADGHTPMEPFSIREGTHNTDRSDYADLPAGDYTMFLLANDGYDVIDSIDFTIRAGKKEEPAPAPEEPAPAAEEPAAAAPAEEPAEAPETPADNAGTASEPTATTTGTEKSGCGSFLGCGPAVLLSVLCAGMIARRKEN